MNEEDVRMNRREFIAGRQRRMLPGVRKLMLAGLLKEQYGVKEIYINYVGAVIGSHSGPGTLALFFLGEHR